MRNSDGVKTCALPISRRCSRASTRHAASSSDGGRTTTRCGHTRPTAASPPRQRIDGPRATGCATPTSSAGRPLPSSRRKRYEQPRTLTIGEGPKGSRSQLRSEEHTSELQSLMRISYAVFCLKKKKKKKVDKNTQN